MTERNTDNVDDVQARIESNERAREVFEARNRANKNVLERMEKSSRARRELRGKIDEIVERQERAEVGAGRSVARGDFTKKLKKAEKVGVEGQTETSAVAEGSAKVDGLVPAEGSAMAEAPMMAEVNLAKKRKRLSRNGKIWLSVGSAVAVALIVVGVVVGVNAGKGGECDGDGGTDSVLLNYTPEGYGEDPSSEDIVAAFNDEIEDKLSSDDNYTDEDALQDYENAYVSSHGDVRLDVTFSYAYFALNAGKSLPETVEILARLESELETPMDWSEYYSAMGNLYAQFGNMGDAEYYYQLADEAVAEFAPTAEEIMQSMEAYE